MALSDQFSALPADGHWLAYAARVEAAEAVLTTTLGWVDADAPIRQ